MLARVNANPRPPASLGDGMLISGGVKMFMDGSGGARTAWMHEDWNKNLTENDTGNTGLSVDAARRVPPDRHRAARRGRSRQHARDRRPRHRLGGRHLRGRCAAKPTRGLRHGIIHANTPTDHAIDVMARLQREFDAALSGVAGDRSCGGSATTTPAISARSATSG